jgi:hypothetical protein
VTLDGTKIADMFKQFAAARKALAEKQDDRANDFFFRAGCPQQVQLKDGTRVTIKIGVTRQDGQKSANQGKLVLSAGKFGTPANRYFATGAFHRDGQLTITPQKDFTEIIGELLQALALDPKGTLSLHRPEDASCCFCGRELTTPESQTVGYGPVCAADRGLPWGEIGPIHHAFTSAELTKEALAQRASARLGDAPKGITGPPGSPKSAQEVIGEDLDLLFPEGPQNDSQSPMWAFDHPEHREPKATAALSPAQKALIQRQAEERACASIIGKSLAPLVANECAREHKEQRRMI